MRCKKKWWQHGDGSTVLDDVLLLLGFGILLIGGAMLMGWALR